MLDLIYLTHDDTKDIGGKVAIITGGGSGIGLETARLLSLKGAKVIVFDFALTDELENVSFIKVDVTDWQNLSSAFKSVVESHGRIDFVHANAGVGEGYHLFQDALDEDEELLPPQWTVIDVNVKGVIQTVKLAVYWFRKLKIAGKIVMSASICGYESAGVPMYAAGKHALIGLLRSASLQLHDEFGICLNAVSPGLTKTNIKGVQIHTQNAAPKDIGGLERQSADKVALAVGYLFSQDCFGKSILSNGGRFREMEGVYQNHRDELLGGEMGVPTVEDPAWKALFKLTF